MSGQIEKFNLLTTSRFLREMQEAKEAGRPYHWANVADLDPTMVEAFGIQGALNIASGRRSVSRAISNSRRVSSHLASSGMSSNRARFPSRKARQEHYTRKAIKEREKEAKRRAAWHASHPGLSESKWLMAEAMRKGRKTALRSVRRTHKRHH